MAKTQRQEGEPTRTRRVRAVLAPLGRASAATTACILWVGLALPGLQLLPGSGGFGDRSIAISLQSALLGIDNGYATTPEARAAMRALGLAVTRRSTGPRPDGAVSLAVEVADGVHTDTANTTPVVYVSHDRSSDWTGTGGAGGDAPDRTSPPQRPPQGPAEPNEPTPPRGGGETPSKPPPAPAMSVQSISFTTSPPTAVVGSSYSVGASASSGLPVSFSLAAGSADVCTISGTTVAFVASGTCTVQANQAGNGSYLPAPQVTQSFDVEAPIAFQSISFTSIPPSDAHVGDADYEVSAEATSGLHVEFGVESDSSGICNVSGAKVHLLGVGTCTINATQRGNSKYHPAPRVLQSFSIGAEAPSQSVQSISFTSSPPPGAIVGGPTYTVTAAASSGLAVTFSSGNPSVCSVSSSTVSFVATGTCTVLANQGGSGSYSAAPQVSQSFDIGQGPQTISFTSTPPSDAYVGGPTYAVAATASSGLAVTFSSGSPSVCSVSGSTVSFTESGTCIVRANQSGNASYQPAPQVQQSFTVVPPPSAQTITFTSNAPANAVYLGPGYDVSATASSGLPVTFTVSGTCTLSGSMVTMAGAGTCTVYANQSGSSAYLAAPQEQQTFSIAKREQTITFPDPGNYDKDDPPFPLSATSSSGLAVTYTLDPGSASTCSLSGNMVTPLERGDCIVHADQAGDANYLAAPQVTSVIKIKNHTPG
jgi:hypothetical protein